MRRQVAIGEIGCLPAERNHQVYAAHNTHGIKADPERHNGQSELEIDQLTESTAAKSLWRSSYHLSGSSLHYNWLAEKVRVNQARHSAI